MPTYRGPDGHRRRLEIRRAVAEPTVAALTPAMGAAAGREAAGVSRTGAHRCECEPTRDRLRLKLAVRRAVAELTVVPAAPAVGSAAGRDAAVVKTTIRRAHRGEGQPALDSHWCRLRPTPAVACAAGGDTAGVMTRAHRGEGEPA